MRLKSGKKRRNAMFDLNSVFGSFLSPVLGVFTQLFALIGSLFGGIFPGA
jgi:hypothetical protein